jgi:Arc/MetJ-type ribon-helix-helix transcriptional regulator
MRFGVAAKLDPMKTLTLELPERVARDVEGLVRAGWFSDEAEVVRLALIEFLNRHQFQLAEQHQREDIAWALEQKTAAE